jgi:hypothetical protein
MRIATTRCVHCKEKYEYIMSGSLEGHINSEYCPICLAVINDALNKIPKKYEPRWISIYDIPRFKDLTLERVLKWEKGHESFCQRIWPGLVDLETGDCFCIRGVPGLEEFTGIFFQVGTWNKRPDFSIKVEVEYNLQTGLPTGEFWK